MSAVLKKLWAMLFDHSQKASDRLIALLGLSVVVLAPIALLVLAIIFAQWALPYIFGGAFLVYLFFGDYIDAAAMRKQSTKDQQSFAERQLSEIVYRNLAMAIAPVVSQVVSMPLEPEDIFYDRAIYPLGDGIYFATPRQLSEQECMKLRRLIVQRLFAKVGIPRQQMFEQGIVSVCSDYIFIRKMPQIIQNFST